MVMSLRPADCAEQAGAAPPFPRKNVTPYSGTGRKSRLDVIHHVPVSRFLIEPSMTN